MGHTSFILDDEIEEWVEGRLVYGQSKSAWYRYAVGTMFHIDDRLDELFERHQYDERQEFIEAAVHEKIERRKADHTNDSTHEE